METAAHERGVTKPHDWEKAVSVAYLRSVGLTQKQAAEGAGCSERTIREWEVSEWWGDAVDEATDRWLAGLRTKARVRLSQALDSGEATASDALKVLERMEPALNPKQRIEHSGPDGLPIDIRGLSDDERAARLASILDAARARRDGRDPDGSEPA